MTIMNTLPSRNPQAIIDILQAKPNNLKLKGTGELNFLLGCDYFREDDGTLMMVPKRYVVKMVETYEETIRREAETDVY